MNTAGIYLLVLLAYPLIQNVSTLLHELGHALPALWLTDSKQVEVYINAYGKKEGALRFRTGRLLFYWHPFRWEGYGCGLTVYQMPRRYDWNYIILLGGVVFSLFVAGALLLIVTQLDLPKFWHTFAILLFAASVVDLFVNLNPNAKEIKLDSGQVTPNDGQRLRQLWQYHPVGKIHEQALLLANEERWIEATESICTMPLDQADEHSLRFLLACIATSGELAEAPIADNAFKLLEEKEAVAAVDWVNFGVILGRRQDYEGALSCLDCVEELEIEESLRLVLLGNRAFVLLEKGDVEQAEPLFRQLSETQPEPYNIAHYGLCLAQLGQQEAGWEKIQKALTLGDNDPYALRCAGLYHLEQGQPEQALHYLQRISEDASRIARLSALLQQAKERKHL
jgi:tetratricopeptide (TPR) repeat protein